MKRNIKHSSLCILACGVFLLGSCDRRGGVTDPDNTYFEPPLNIEVNTPKYSYKNASEDEALTNKYVQITEENVTAAVEVERTIESDKNSELSKGIHYKIVAYKKEGEKYNFQFSKDFVAGNESKIPLNKSQTYTLIIYSFGNKDVVPDMVDQNDFDNAYIPFNPSDKNESTGLLYQRIESFKPDEKDKLNIDLEYKISRIKLIIDASDFYGGNNSGRITTLNDIELSYPRYEIAELAVNKGELRYKGEETKTIRNLDFTTLSASKKESNWLNLFINKAKNKGNITLNAKIIVDGIESNIPYRINIKNVKENFKQTINLKLELCGLYYNNANRWKQYMCHDLGVSDYSANPLKANPTLYGEKHQWASVNYVSPKDYLRNNVISDWVKSFPSSSNSREESYWGGNDPCPESYKITDDDDLRELSRHKFVKSANWTNTGQRNGFELANKKEGKLFFQATGYIDEGGRFSNKNNEANLWSRSEDPFFREEANSLKIYIESDEIYTKYSQKKKINGFSIRCVKKAEYDYKKP